MSSPFPPLGPPPSPEVIAEDYGPQLLAISCTLFGIAAATMVLRMYVRIFILKMFGIDDWLMLVAVGLSLAIVGLFVRCISLGLGRHFPYGFPMENLGEYFKWIYVYAILIIFAYSFIKLSIGFFLLRLADRTRWRRFLQATLVFLVVFTLGSTFAIIFQCIPVAAAYDFSLKEKAKCYPPDIFKNIGVFNSSINIATDLLFALLPIPIVWKLQVNIRTKVGLAFCMGLGLFASATAIYKVPMQYHFFEEMDFTGHGSWYYIWQQVELNIGITAANLPTLKPLFASFFKSIRTMATYGSRTNRSALTQSYRASGYLKQADDEPFTTPGTTSFVMSNLSGKSMGGSDKDWGKRAGDSDESILRDQVIREGGLTRMPNGRIMRTTEVNITR